MALFGYAAVVNCNIVVLNNCLTFAESRTDFSVWIIVHFVAHDKRFYIILNSSRLPTNNVVTDQ